MHSREWPLVVFTTLTQMAVGAFLALETVLRLADYPTEAVDALVNPALVLIIPMLVGGGVVAAAHLARPSRAVGVIANLGTSWLSREMLLSGIFGLLVTLYAALRWLEIGAGALQDIVALGTALGGITLVYGISRLYRLRTVPAWNTPATPISFFATALLLGMLVVSVEFVALHSSNDSAQKALLADTFHWIGPVAAVLVGLQLAVIAGNIAYLSGQGRIANESVRVLLGDQRGLFLSRLVLAIIGIVFLVVFANQSPDTTGYGWLWSAFGVVLVAEVLGRFLFYAAYRRVGL